MWDWDWEDYVESGKQQQEWWDSVKTKNMKEDDKKKYLENKDKPKVTPPTTYNDPTGLIIYIAVMLIGTIFVDRWLIWVVATLIYFGRKR